MEGTVLVAGATGVVGRAVVARLQDRGARIRTFSRHAGRADSLKRAGADVRTGDACDRSSLTGVADGVDVVFSCLGAPVTFGGERRSFKEVDTVANRNLLQAAVAAKVRRFVYVAVHVEDGYRDTAYVQAHEIFADELRRSPLAHAVVRCTGLFPVFAQMVDMARRGLVAIPGDGRAETNPVHADDVADMCRRAIEGEIDDVSIGGPEVMTREQIARLAFAAVQKHPRVMHIPAGLMLGSAKFIQPFNPHAAELIEFATRVFTSRCVAPSHGHRGLAEYFAEVVRPQGRAAS